MSKKALIFGLFAALVASSVVGAVTAPNALADAPYGTLTCSAVQQSVVSGDLVTLNVAYAGYGYLPSYASYSWQAVGGTPSSGTGSSFSTRFYTSSINELRVVTVTDGSQTAACQVYVYNSTPSWPWTPTPTPWSSLSCAAVASTINSGDIASLNAWGGNGSYSWSTANGMPSSGWGSNFSTRFYNYGSSAQSQIVTVTSGGQSATCTLWVNGSYYVTPTPTPYYYGNVSVDHSVSNLSRGGSGSSVTAYNGDRLQFTVRITTGNQYAEDVHVRDWLPQYVNYVAGSTTVDGAWYQDGIATGRDTDSLALASNLAPNRTYTVRFDGIVAGAPNTTLTNSVNVHARGFADQNRTATITVNGSSYYPTPIPDYPYNDSNSRIVVRQFGRDVTRGQSGEYASVRARGGDTLDLIVRIRSTNGSYLSNAYVTDILPSGVSYIPRSTTLNGSVVGDGITSSGIAIGTIAPNSETVVKFSVRVDQYSVPTWGSVTVNNTANVRADGLATMSAQMPITIGQNLDITSVSGVKTGPADSILIALMVSLLATGAYAAYTRTGVFSRRMALAEIGALSRKNKLDFSR